jgi:hypothetical protein
MTRKLTYLWIVIAVLGVLVSSVYSQTLTLTGENFASTTAEGSITCVNNSQAGTLRFTGVAIGPYPGQFTEVITITSVGGLPGETEKFWALASCLGWS